ncbi:hypothetical protein [Ruania alba]|uniref:DUF3137 domain-containing protein n=1 Tax=Ruania alba TaxID=648782 RepID=A0A1H5KNU5_9MICO|nr:hypothetical protein [Ruania alba]SEE66433.1 hypothetical protein SAMN04488554_2366 [Ruania alba]
MDEGSWEALFTVLIWILIPGIVVVIIVVGMRNAKKRREFLMRWAAGRGWNYSRSGRHMVGRWQSPPFGRGNSRRAENVLTGTFHGQNVVSMTYQYSTGSGKNRSTHYFHVLALHLPAPLPWLQLSPEHLGTSIAKFFGGQDVEFESSAFNDAWRVKGPEGQYPYDVIHPRMMERLLQPDAIGRSISIEGPDILLHVSGRQQVQMIDLYLNLLYGISELIPRHVWLRVGHDPGV